MQVPYLKGHTRNELERLLSIFDQSQKLRDESQLIQLDENQFDKNGLTVINRLKLATTSRDVREQMFLEDNELMELELKETRLMEMEGQLQESEKGRKIDSR